MQVPDCPTPWHECRSQPSSPCLPPTVQVGFVASAPQASPSVHGWHSRAPSGKWQILLDTHPTTTTTKRKESVRDQLPLRGARLPKRACCSPLPGAKSETSQRRALGVRLNAPWAMRRGFPDCGDGDLVDASRETQGARPASLPGEGSSRQPPGALRCGFRGPRRRERFCLPEAFLCCRRADPGSNLALKIGATETAESWQARRPRGSASVSPH